eukprot:752547-Hanusia_phi.AAC.1
MFLLLASSHGPPPQTVLPPPLPPTARLASLRVSTVPLGVYKDQGKTLVPPRSWRGGWGGRELAPARSRKALELSWAIEREFEVPSQPGLAHYRNNQPLSWLGRVR